ncbi:MAG: Asp-tRNA(Asn)/Glu-tRNA(Gln) amidotransferase subunit GatA [Spirochaetes bacterium]|nr:Asp-tRNA(Asn)/Glu-tRNA(Gln) amidotransferase subunit GatA [Spirochaetota bacterium]MBL7006116.1 Asp-tRNA(Asn)/Glu-tRNA(Gln) amidotransferase subunit GatA [Spirochaetia bacterium]
MFWRGLTGSVEQRKRYNKLITEADSEISAFLEINPESGASLLRKNSESQTSSPLSGLPFGVKDNIAVEKFQLTCGSKILNSFVSPYSATAVSRLLAAGAVPVGKANMDEFGMGSSTENSAYKTTVNPWDHAKVPGGSSGGSAAAVAAGLVPFALGSDTGGSVRQPAAFCGTYGLKPTYGSVSRYGLVAYASSLECVGVLADSVEMTKNVFTVIGGKDPMDQTSSNGSVNSADAAAQPYTIGVLSKTEGLDPAVAEAYGETIEQMKLLGWKIREISLNTQEYVVPAYYTIATAEASANLARYTGIRYGMREKDITDHENMVRLTRENGFGDEVKLRILLGTYVLRSGFQDQYYVRAQKIRTLIRNEINTLFTKVDMILMPVFPTQAFRFGSQEMTPYQQKLADKYTVTANLAGIPSLSFPTGLKSGLPVGLQLMAPDFCESRLFDAAGVLSGGRSIQLAPGAMSAGEVS